MARLARAFPATPIIRRQRFSSGTAFSQSVNATSIVMVATRNAQTSRNLASSLAAVSQSAPLSVVNITTASDATGSNVANPFTTPAANHSSGNLLAVLIRTAIFGSITSITDTAGNTYQRFGNTYSDVGANDFVQWWYAKNIIGNASNVLSVTFTSNVQFAALLVYQIAGADPGSPTDTGADVGNATVSTTVATSPSFSTASANEIILFGCNVAALSETWTAGLIGGVTATLNTDSNKIASAEYVIAPAIQSGITASASYNSSATVVYAVAAFKAAPSSNSGAFAGRITRSPGRVALSTLLSFSGQLGGRQASGSKSAGSNPFGGSNVRSIARTQTAVQAPLTVTAVKLLTHALTAVTVAMNAISARLKGSSSSASLATLSGSRVDAMGRACTGSPPAMAGSRKFASVRSIQASTIPPGGTISRAVSKVASAVGNAFSGLWSGTKNAASFTLTVAATLVAMAASTLRSESRASSSSTSAPSGSTVRSVTDSRAGAMSSQNATDSQSVGKTTSASGSAFAGTGSRKSARTTSASTNPSAGNTSRLIARIASATTAAFNGLLAAVQSGAHVLVFSATMLATAATTARAAARSAVATQVPGSGAIAKRINRALLAIGAAFSAFITSIRLTSTIPRIRLTGQSDSGANLKGSTTVNASLTGEASSDDDLTGQQ